MLDMASERILAQIAACERVRDRRFVDALGRGQPRAPAPPRPVHRERLVLAALLVEVVGVLVESMPLALIAGVVFVAWRVGTPIYGGVQPQLGHLSKMVMVTLAHRAQ